ESNLILPRVDLPLYRLFITAKNTGFHCVWTVAYPLPYTGAAMNPKFFWLLTAILLAFFHQAEAQQPTKLPRIGLLSAAANPARPILWEPFIDALREMGYVERTNIIIERRFAGGKNERVPEFAADLVHLNVNVIVATGTTEIRAAKLVTTTIPIVMVLAPDPIESGLVANLPHPGGNITGLSLLAPELTGKRLELLREAVPGSSRFALLSWADESLKKDAEVAAQALGVQVRAVEVRNADGLPNVFAGIARDR